MCVNSRDDGACCQDWGADSLLKHMRGRFKGAGLHGAGLSRVNKAGCMDRCAEGPTLVIYPDGVWYRYESEEDLDEIFDSHIMNGVTVDRLLI